MRPAERPIPPQLLRVGEEPVGEERHPRSRRPVAETATRKPARIAVDRANRTQTRSGDQLPEAGDTNRKPHRQHREIGRLHMRNPSSTRGGSPHVRMATPTILHDLPMSNLSGGGLHPVRTPRTAARPWRHARPAPQAWGRPWTACSGSSRDVGSHLRSVAPSMAVCATLSTLSQVLCRGQCYVPEALRGRWHCLASDSIRES